MEKTPLSLQKDEGMHGQASHASKHWPVAQCQEVFWVANVEVTAENAFSYIQIYIYVYDICI